MNKQNIKLASIVLLVLGLVAVVIKVILLLAGTIVIWGVIGMLFYMATGYFGLRLANYDLEDDEIKTTITRLGLAGICCIASLFFDGIAVLILAVIMFGFFYSLKSNYDDWNQRKAERNNIE